MAVSVRVVVAMPIAAVDGILEHLWELRLLSGFDDSVDSSPRRVGPIADAVGSQAIIAAGHRGKREVVRQMHVIGLRVVTRWTGVSHWSAKSGCGAVDVDGVSKRSTFQTGAPALRQNSNWLSAAQFRRMFEYVPVFGVVRHRE